MIDPRNITNFNRSELELQEFLLFAIVVAGKNSKVQAQKLDDFLNAICQVYRRDHLELANDYFHAIRNLDPEDLDFWLRECRMGQYQRISNAFAQLAYDNPPLKTITIEALERVNGVGPKTARFFMLHSFAKANCAVLDTHILRFLRNNDVENVPTSTPQNMSTYKRLEKKFLEFVADTNYSVAEYDLLIWKMYSK